MEDKRGGTGRTFHWDLAVKAKEADVPIILSGGITPSNVGEAVSAVKPFAVDVNSGVEQGPGKKDPVLMEALMGTLRTLFP
jgi:phosphoribosylanthranilate isomerase